MTLALFQMHWPCSKLSWEMKQELRKAEGAQWFVLLDVMLPGTTLRYASNSVAATTRGLYDSRILEMTSLVRATSDRDTRMQDVEMDITVDDTNLAFASAVEGPQGHIVRGSVATLTLGSPNVPPAQWFTVFSGVVWAYQMLAPRRWQFTVRPNDLPLQKATPKVSIAQPDWPNADPSVWAQYGPLLYGNHDSSTTTAKGAVPLVYVDKTLFRYLLCWGRAKAIDSVYADGVKQVSGFTVSYTQVGGRDCTIVTFTADQGAKAITADARGYENIGDGTGTLIEAPTDAIRHFLTQWVYNDYKSGNWLTEANVPIDTATMATTAAFLARSGSRAARRISGAQRNGIDVLNEWALSWQARLFWTNAGKIGCRVEDFSPLSLYRDDQAGWIRYDHTPFDPQLAPEWENLIDRVDIEYHFDEVADKYLFSLQVRDPALNFEAPDSLQLPWSAVSTV